MSHTYYEQKSAEEQALPSPYFWELTNNFEKRMQECRQRIDELELYLASIHNARRYTPKMLQDIIDNQHEFFVTIAASLAAVHEAVDVLREDYLALRKRIDRNARANPFEEAQRWREEKSLTSMADAKLKKKQVNAGGLAAWGQQQQQTQQQQPQQQQQQQSGAFGAFGATTGTTAMTTGTTTGWGAPAAPTATATGGGGFSFGAPAATGATGGFSFGNTTGGATSKKDLFGASGYVDI